MPDLRVGLVNAATPTPLKPDGAFDAASAKRLCRRWRDIGLDGVLVLGTMGEGPLLSDAVRNAFVETALAEAGDTVTIFVSAADVSGRRMMERALHYARMGAHCVVLCIPPKVSVARAIADVKAVADACPVPCAYYDVPANTGTELVVDEILEILTHPNIRACKDSSHNPLIAQGITDPERRPKDKAILDGCEYHSANSKLLGYDGMLHGGGVMTGRWMRAIWEKAAEGKWEETAAMDREKARFLAAVYNRFRRPLQNIIGQKYVLKLLGCLASETAIVDQCLDDASRARIAETVNRYRRWIE